MASAKIASSPLMSAMCGPKKHMGKDVDVTKLSRDERVASVGPLIIALSKKFWMNLSGREQANFDLEDIALELWAEIASKDEHYDASRGRYTTFAMDLAWKFLAELRNQMRTVRSPRNADSRLKKMDDNSLTAKAIVSSMKEPCTLSDTHDEEEDESDSVMLDEFMADSKAMVESAVIDGLGDMPTHSRIITLAYGLDGNQPLNTAKIGDKIGMPQRDVLSMKREAESVIRSTLLKMVHSHDVELPILTCEMLI